MCFVTSLDLKLLGLMDQGTSSGLNTTIPGWPVGAADLFSSICFYIQTGCRSATHLSTLYSGNLFKPTPRSNNRRLPAT